MKEIFIDDVREEFVREYVFPMFRCAELLACRACVVFQHLVLLHHVPLSAVKILRPIINGIGGVHHWWTRICPVYYQHLYAMCHFCVL